jgi:hypothetical protein
LVVSWKDAADRNESVFSEALVIPRMISSAGQEVGVALLVDPHLLHHLAHDQLDVLVVDVHALGLVDLLDLLDQVQLGLGPAADGQQLVGIQRALVQLGARLDLLPGGHEQAGPAGERVAMLLATVIGDHHGDRSV